MENSLLAQVWGTALWNVNSLDLWGGQFEIDIPSFKMYMFSVPVTSLLGDYPKEIVGQARKAIYKE